VLGRESVVGVFVGVDFTVGWREGCLVNSTYVNITWFAHFGEVSWKSGGSGFCWEMLHVRKGWDECEGSGGESCVVEDSSHTYLHSHDALRH
jgi:hypothetical protein